MDYSCEPKFNMSEEASKQARTLKILFFLYITLSLVRMIVLRDFSSFLNDMITSILLLFTSICANFLLASIVIILLLFNILNTLLFLGLRIQNKTLNIPDPFGRPTLFNFIIFYTIFLVIFYIICVIYTFYAYREFKCLESEQNSSGAYRKDIFLILEPVAVNERPPDRIIPVNRQPATTTAFTGRGTTWG